jgi:capsid assembly protease
MSSKIPQIPMSVSWVEDHYEIRTPVNEADGPIGETWVGTVAPRRDSHLVAALFSEPWAILPAKLAAIVEVVENHRAGLTLLAEQAAQFEAGPRPSPRAAGGVQVIPVYGVVAQRMNLMTQFSGGVSTEKLAADIRKAAADPSVKAIVLDVDSPGGSVFGVDELAAVIMEARKSKHIVAVANSLCASAAYWLASACDEIVVTPSGQVGSIGVISAHTDDSKAEEMLGFKTTYVTAGKYKGELAGPLTDEARAALQASADDYYGKFTTRVAKGRGVPAAKVRNGYGEGRLLTADKALAEGMVDRIATLEDVLARLGAGPVVPRGLEAETVPALAAETPTLPEPVAAPAPMDAAPAADKSLIARRRRLALAERS